MRTMTIALEDVQAGDIVVRTGLRVEMTISRLGTNRSMVLRLANGEVLAGPRDRKIQVRRAEPGEGGTVDEDPDSC